MDDAEIIARWREVTADLGKKHLEVASVERVLIDARVGRWRQAMEEGVSSMKEGDQIVYLDTAELQKDLITVKAERSALTEEKDYLDRLL